MENKGMSAVDKAMVEEFREGMRDLKVRYLKQEEKLEEMQESLDRMQEMQDQMQDQFDDIDLRTQDIRRVLTSVRAYDDQSSIMFGWLVLAVGLVVNLACVGLASPSSASSSSTHRVKAQLTHLVEGKRRASKGFHTCPVYMYPVRSGSRERPSYVVSVNLRAGKFSADFWTKRGVAMLLSTAL